MENNICKTAKKTRTSFFTVNPQAYPEEGYKLAWLRQIRAELDDEILHSGTRYKFKITNLDTERSTYYTANGPELTLKILELNKKPASIQIENLTKNETLVILIKTDF